MTVSCGSRAAAADEAAYEVTDEQKIATHSDPGWRDRTNYIVQLDLTGHGMPGSYEQCWTRTDDQELFELCCIPFFTYGQSLGDILKVDLGTGQQTVARKQGHRTMRFAFTDDRQAHAQHHQLHGSLVEEAHCLIELRQGGRYGAIDIDDPSKTDLVIGILTPHHAAGYLIWEWADPPSMGPVPGLCAAASNGS